MKAAFIEKPGPPENIKYGELPDPNPGDSQVLVRVKAVAVNPIDTYIRAGAIAMPLPFPFIIGCDLAGTVEACANVAPKLYVELCRAFREGRHEEAARLQSLAGELAATVGLHTFPSMIKEALNIVGLPAGPCRRPVGPVPRDAREELVRALTRLAAGKFLLGSARVQTA